MKTEITAFVCNLAHSALALGTGGNVLEVVENPGLDAVGLDQLLR